MDKAGRFAGGWHLAIALLLSSVVGIAAARSAPLSNERSIGNSSYTVATAGNDIVVTANSSHRMVFSAARLAHAEFRRLRAQSGLAAGVPFWVSQSFSVVSLFGPYLALRDRTLIEQGSGALPGGGVRYWTVDLRGPGVGGIGSQSVLVAMVKPNGAIVSLDALYSPAQIAAALARDPFVRKYVTPDVGATPRGILRRLVGATISSKTVCIDAPRDVLSSFAIIKVAGNSLGVRLGLPGRSFCRDRLTGVGLVLPFVAAVRSVVGPDARVVVPRRAMGVTIVEGRAPSASGSGGQFSPAE